MVALLLLVLALIGGWSAVAEAQDLLGDDLQGHNSLGPNNHLTKRDLEFNQYVPAYRLRGEPSCEELRAMWRYSKREARRATSTNQLPRTRPYRYGRVMQYAMGAYGGPRPPIYGTLTYDSRNRQHYRHKGAFNRLRAMLGPRRVGAFNDLREMVSKDLKEGETSEGQLKNLRGILMKEIKDEEVALQHARDVGPGIARRRDPSIPLRPLKFQKEGFAGSLLPGNPKLAYYQQSWEPLKPLLTSRDCSLLQMSECQVDSDCSCEGQYVCSNYRCLVLPQGDEDEFGVWYYQSLPDALLGDWPVHQSKG